MAFWIIWVVIIIVCFLLAEEVTPYRSNAWGTGLFYSVLASILYLLFMFHFPVKFNSSHLEPDQYETFRSDKLAIYVIGKDVLKSDDSWVYMNYQDTSRIKIRRTEAQSYFGDHVGNSYKIDIIEND